MRLTTALGALFLSATTAFGALSATLNSAYDGGISANGYTASGALTLTLNFAPAPGQQLLLVNNTAASAISGTFTGLAEGATRTATYGGNTFTFRISYVGGTGNDITLTRVAGAGQVTNSNTYLWSHLAGSTGGPGSQDGLLAVAGFNTPEGVAVDSVGNIYVADTQNSTIRKVTSGGVVTTLAGTKRSIGSTDGTGSAARFQKPIGVAVDSAGNVYVADSWNRTIRKVTPAGVVTTLAGSAGIIGSADGTGSAARFDFPTGVAVDSAGNIYVADSSRIRKVTSAGVVTTLAGRYGINGSTDGTGSAALFHFLYGVALDGAGNVYVTDISNHTIRKVTSAGVATTLAGKAYTSGSSNGTGSAARFNNPTGIAVDGSGNVYVADEYNNRIRKITPAGASATLAGLSSGSSDGTGSAAQFFSPKGMSMDSSGNVYVSDSNNHAIRKITQAGAVTTLAGGAAVYGSVDSIGSTARFQYPSGIAMDNSGNVYVSALYDSSIRKVTSSGLVTTLPGGFFNGVSGGISIDGTGNIYSVHYGTIKKMTSAGVMSILAGTEYTSGSIDGTGSSARFSTARDVALDNSGNIYVADTGNHTIRKVTQAGVVTTVAGTAGSIGSTDGTGSAARFNEPNGVAVDSTGNVYVADYGNHRIRKVTPTGVVTTMADTVGRAVYFYQPLTIAVDGSGNVYASNRTMIIKVNPAGLVATLGGNGGEGRDVGYGSSASFSWPKIEVNSSGRVYLIDNYPRVVHGEEAGFQPILTQGSGSSLSPSGVTLNGTVNPNGFVTTASFEYGLTSTYGSSASVTLSSSNGTTAQNVSAALTGLSPATLYYYRLTASNVDGTTSTSGGTFTTMSAMSTNADLSGLTLSSGTLSPTFASATTSYTASVANAPASITITPTSAQANATLEVKVDGGTYAAVSSGSPSSLLSLDVGSNTIDVRVTAQDGVTQKTYSLVVTRLPSTNANLSGLTLSSGTLSPAFASGTTSYAASVDNVTASITVTSIQAQADASLAVRVNAGAYAAVISGSPSSALSLNVGNNTIDVRVTAQDGVTQKIYTVQLTVSPPTNPSGSIASWRQQHFGSDQNSGNAADLAAPDGDGIPNLVKYALLMTPGQNSSSRLPQAEMTGTSGSRRLTLTFQRDPSRSDVTIVVEAQSGLGGAWSEITRSTYGAGFTGAASVSVVDGVNGTKNITVEDVQTNASNRFMRVKVER